MEKNRLEEGNFETKKICAQCGAQNDAKDEFCQNCGNALTEKTQDIEKNCPMCGAVVCETDEFCQSCGAKVRNTQDQPVTDPNPMINPAVKEKKKLSKKAVAVICCVLAVCVIGLGFFIATYKSKEVRATESAITAIANVTLQSGTSIEKAESLYDALEPKDKEKVENIETLKKSRKTYDDLCTKKAAEDLDKAIASLGKITLDSSDAISEARSAYNDLNEKGKALVKNLSVLEKAEAALEKLEKAEEERLRKEAELEKKRKKEKMNSLKSNFRSDHDKFEGNTWYYHDNYPKYTNTRNFLLPYIGYNNGSVWLRLKYNYMGDNWIFWEKATILVDGKKTVKDFGYMEVERDNGYGDVWETYDESVDTSQRELLESIVKSDNAAVRFEGEDYRYDFTIKSSDKRAIKQTLQLYDAMCDYYSY